MDIFSIFGVIFVSLLGIILAGVFVIYLAVEASRHKSEGYGREETRLGLQQHQRFSLLDDFDDGRASAA